MKITMLIQLEANKPSDDIPAELQKAIAQFASDGKILSISPDGFLAEMED